MGECYLDAGDVRLCYEIRGDDLGPTAPTVVLIMGLGLDLLWWRDDFCDELVRRGMRVVRFDNRDVGRSTRLSGPAPGRLAYLTRRAVATYTLEDMAEDTGALIDAVAPKTSGVHLVGVSMGAMIAQATAIRFAGRVRSLVSIMGRPGDGRSGKMSTPMALRSARPGPADPAENMVAAMDRIGSLGRTVVDQADVRSIVAASAARAATDSQGAGRQLAAVLRETDRTEGLRGYDRPALVIHGDHDRVIKPSGGRATADALPDSELLILPGMGHDLARWLWRDIIGGIERTVRRAEAAAARATRVDDSVCD